MLIAILVRRKIAWQGQNKTGECEGQEKTQKYFFNEKKNILYDSQILSNPPIFHKFELERSFRKKCFILSLKVFKFLVFFKISGILFQIAGPI